MRQVSKTIIQTLTRYLPSLLLLLLHLPVLLSLLHAARLLLQQVVPLSETQLASLRQLLEAGAIGYLPDSVLAFLDALQRCSVRIECLMDTSASLLGRVVLGLEKTKDENEFTRKDMRPRSTYLSLKIAVLLDLGEVRAQFGLYGLLNLLDAILHQEELLELCVGPRPRGPA